jgi:hypothetical protein
VIHNNPTQNNRNIFIQTSSFFSAARCVYASQIDFCSTKHDEHAPRFDHIDDDNNNNNNNTHQRKMEAKQRQQ